MTPACPDTDILSQKPSKVMEWAQNIRQTNKTENARSGFAYKLQGIIESEYPYTCPSYFPYFEACQV